MTEFIKKNFAIILAFVLPVAFILVVVAVAYLPALFLSTDYNFLYVVCGDGRYYYNCDHELSQSYSVVDGKLTVSPVDPAQDSNRNQIPDAEEYNARIFLYDTAKNESREIPLAEAQTFSLSNLLTSPDGVTVSEYYQRGGSFLFLFNSAGSDGYYLNKGSRHKKINLINNYNQRTFHFIGWILPAGN